MIRSRRFYCVTVGSWLMYMGSVTLAQPAMVLPAQGTIQLAFTPWDDAESLLIGTVDRARQQILMQAYVLTSQKIAASLVAAKMRGVDVRVLADASQHAQTPSSLLDMLVRAGIPVWLETKYRSAHNKVIVIDANDVDPAVISGSFNFTWSAQHRNAENLLLMRGNPALVSQYVRNWERHWRDATIYNAKP